MESKKPEKIIELFQKFDFGQKKAKEFLELAVKQAIQEIVNLLDERLPKKDKTELLLFRNSQ